MITCKTPFRISLFGGGTDFPDWFNKKFGMTISFTIDKYCYLSLRTLPSLFPFKYRLRYILSNSFINNANSKYYLSGWFLNISFNKIEVGASRNILSGGYQDLNWGYFDAMLIPFTNKNLKYWDEINDYFIKYTSKKDKLVIFIEYGLPNRFFDGKNPAIYNNHSTGSNIGFRKYDAFDKTGLLWGVEYARLVQGQFFDS